MTSQPADRDSGGGGADEEIPASILLVDDHPPNLVALQAILAPLGHELVTAHSGEEALKALLTRDFAVILMDVQMPGMDGLQTTALIKRRRRTRDIPIIFLTAIHRDEANVFAGYEHGAVDYLLKPYDPVVLRSKVAVFVDLYRQRETVRRQAALLREREREALEKRSEQRFRNLTDAMPQCVWAARPDGTVHYCNRVLQDYTGLGADECVRLGIAVAAHPDDVERARTAWSEALASGGPMEIQYRLRRHDGAYRWHLGRALPEHDEQGALVGWIATATDIDEQKRAEEARTELLEREQQLRAQAEAARREAESANRTKDEFLATVSHELRTPLNAILGWTRMLRAGTVPESRHPRALETIERNATVQAQLVEDMLDVSRIITGKLRLNFAAVDLGSVLEAAVDGARPTAESKGVALELDLTAPRATVSGDADRLQQVMWNLLSNAVKFTPRGGKVSVHLAQVESHLEVEVRDSGEGIPADFLPYVFDRFRQADGSSTRTHSGLGLGLAIVRHLVEAHGGTVAVKSEGEGKGATFTVVLPIPAVRPSAPAEPGSPGLSPRRTGRHSAVSLPRLDNLRVLVVDDEVDARDLVAALLEQRGALVRAVGSVDDALAATRESRYDMIVSDIGMPGQDGYVLARRVRALTDAERARVPMLALTAYARNEDRARVIESGFQAHLVKPVDPAELLNAVAELAAGAAGGDGATP